MQWLASISVRRPVFATVMILTIVVVGFLGYGKLNVDRFPNVDFHTAANDNGPAYHGKIRYIGPSVRAQTRDAVVEAAIENPGHDLRPGMFVTARLALGEQSLPAVPASAVRADGNLRHVFVNVSGRLEDRLVQTAETLGSQTPIVSGLKAGEQVVAELTPDVRDGAKVSGARDSARTQ